jgi:hypothetical protein
MEIDLQRPLEMLLLLEDSRRTSPTGGLTRRGWRRNSRIDNPSQSLAMSFANQDPSLLRYTTRHGFSLLHTYGNQMALSKAVAMYREELRSSFIVKTSDLI